MQTPIHTVMILFVAMACTMLLGTQQAEGRIGESHWSFNNFPGAQLKYQHLRKPAHQEQSTKHIDKVVSESSSPSVMDHFQSHIPSVQESLASLGHKARPSRPVSAFRSQMTEAKQAQLVRLVEKLWRHKKAEYDYSNHLLSSFGSRVAPGHRK